MRNEKNIADKYDALINYDLVNKAISLSNDKDLQAISKKTVANIAKWALNGSSNAEIAENLELSQKQFKVLCEICPVLIYVMKESREMADIVIAGSLFQTAIGGKVIHKRVPIKVKDYENGVCVGEHIEYADTTEEMKPDSYLLKFLAENKLSEKFGKEKVDSSEEHKKIIGALDICDIEKIEAVCKDDKR